MTDRRQFLSSLWRLTETKKEVKTEQTPFKPLLPGFVLNPEGGCETCESSACKLACPQGIVIRHDKSIPYLDFSQRGCTFCGECETACQQGCFSEGKHKHVETIVTIDTKQCLAWNGTICRSCADACNDRAIVFTGLWKPVINPDTCTACGFCAGKCPSDAIRFHPPMPKVEEA